MKEQQSIILRRTTVHALGNPPLILPNSSFSHRKLSNAQSTVAKLPQRNSIQKFQIQNPPILKQEKYQKLYNNILKDMKLIHKHIAVQQGSKQKQKVKQSISKVIRLNSQEGDFNERFGLKSEVRRASSVHSKKRPQNIGFTQQQKQTEKRKSFFTDHRKVIGLEEQCMLLEYYLKDQEGDKTQVNYLKGLDQTSRHRRITPSKKDSFKLHVTHDEKEYSSLKRRVHLKEQFVQKCIQFAKKNTTYRRKQNFREIQFVLKQHNRSLMEQTILAEDNDEQEKAKLLKNNKMIRLYLSYGFLTIQTKVDEAKTELSLKKFKEDLFTLDANFSFRQKDIQKKIESILQFKHQRIIRYQDFKELLFFLEKILNKDILTLFYTRFPECFIRKEEVYLTQHWNEVDRYFSSHKVKFLLELMFRTFPEKLIGAKVLPIAVIPAIFKAYGISEKDFQLEQLYKDYHWVQHRDAGLTFQQFYEGSILMKMRGVEWKGIEVFLKKINIKKYI